MNEAYHTTEQAATTGYTRISDIIIDRWMPRLSGARFKIVMYIARRTYGFGKDSDRVSTPQMVHGIKKADGTVLDEGTGLDRSTVIRECKWLASEGVLHKMGVKSGGQHMTNLWALNLEAVVGEDGKGSWKSARVVGLSHHPQKPENPDSETGPRRIIPPPPSDYPTHNRQLDNKQSLVDDLSLRSRTSTPRGFPASSPENTDFHDDFPGGLEAIKWDLDDLVDEAKDDFADPEALKKDADEAVFSYQSGRKDITAFERRALFAARDAAKAKIDATTSSPHQPTPQRNHGSDEAVEGRPRVYDGPSMGDALLQAIDEAEDDDERRGFERLLLQWQRARDKEYAGSPPDGCVTDTDGSSLPALHLADQQTVQTVLEAVEIEDF